MGVILPLALSLGGSLLMKRLFGGKRPGVPDFKTPALARLNAQYDMARQRMASDREALYDRVVAEDAAAGVSGSGNASRLSRLFGATTQATADLEAQRAGQIADAQIQFGNQEQLLRYQDEMDKWQTRQQGLSDIAEGFNQYYMLNSMLGGPSLGDELKGAGLGLWNTIKGMPAMSREAQAGPTPYPRLGLAAPKGGAPSGLLGPDPSEYYRRAVEPYDALYGTPYDPYHPWRG